MKYPKTHARLVDSDGWCWVEADLTPPAIKRIIKEYLKQDIWLTLI